MRNYDAPTLAALGAQAIVERGMILFDLVSGFYGFWEGVGPLVYSGVTFHGAGSLISLEAGQVSGQMESQPVTVRLFANPDLGITEDLLQTIEAETYHQRPVTVYRAYFDPDTRALISVNVEWRGLIDRITHDETPEGYAITGHLESRSLDYSKRGWAMASNEQQKLVSAGDVFFEYAGTAGRTRIYFGQEVPKSAGDSQPAGRPPL